MTKCSYFRYSRFRNDTNIRGPVGPVTLSVPRMCSCPYYDDLLFITWRPSSAASCRSPSRQPSLRGPPGLRSGRSSRRPRRRFLRSAASSSHTFRRASYRPWSAAGRQPRCGNPYRDTSRFGITGFDHEISVRTLTDPGFPVRLAISNSYTLTVSDFQSFFGLSDLLRTAFRRSM